ncbi:MAG: hypothetical protein ACKOTB_04510 [Planctomycetia bacterium]
MSHSDSLSRLLAILEPSLAIYLADSGIWSYPGKESIKLALADLVDDLRSLITRIATTLESRGKAAAKETFPIAFTALHDVDMRWLAPRVAADLRDRAAAIGRLADAAAEDAEAVELATEARGLLTRHADIVERSPASAA